MGKSLITQKRGKGSPAYRSPSHRFVARVIHRAYDEAEKNGKVTGEIMALVDCPGHSAPLALVRYNNELQHIFAPLNVRVGDFVESGSNASVINGSTLPLSKIPEGTQVYNVEAHPADGGVFARSAGESARVVSKESGMVTVELPSKKTKALDGRCRANIGVIAGSGRSEKPFVKVGKKFMAMHARNKLYPRSAGVAMNAVAHPFGSGRGRHIGKAKTPPKFAPAGRNIGLLHARRSGRRK